MELHWRLASVSNKETTKNIYVCPPGYITSPSVFSFLRWPYNSLEPFLTPGWRGTL